MQNRNVRLETEKDDRAEDQKQEDRKQEDRKQEDQKQEDRKQEDRKDSHVNRVAHRKQVPNKSQRRNEGDLPAYKMTS